MSDFTNLDRENEAASVIQKSFRRYLENKRKHESGNERNADSEIQLDKLDIAEHEVTTDEACKELRKFYEKLSLNAAERQKYVENLFLEIERNIELLKNSGSLDSHAKRSSGAAKSNDVFSEEAVNRHQQQLKALGI